MCCSDSPFFCACFSCECSFCLSVSNNGVLIHIRICLVHFPLQEGQIKGLLQELSMRKAQLEKKLVSTASSFAIFVLAHSNASMK